MARFLFSRHAKGLKVLTINWYRTILNKFQTRFKKLPGKPEQVEEFIASLNVGDERRHGYYRAIRCFYKFLAKRYHVRNPMPDVEPPRRTAKDPKFLTPDSVNKLLAYPHPPTIKAAIMFLIDTSTRLCELFNLRIEDLEETPWGFVARINGKTGMRIVPISYETYHALMISLPFNYSIWWLGKLITRAFKNAGLKGGSLTLRHTFGTLWEGDELVLQRIMGHRELSTTKIYRHLRMKVLCTQHNQFSPLKMVLSSSKNML